MTPELALAILGMAACSLSPRVVGFLLAGRLPQSGRAKRWLQQIPPAVLAALVAPAVLKGSPAELIAAAATAVVAALTRNLLAAMLAGVAAVYLLRQVL